MNQDCATYELDPIDRLLIRLTQGGLPLVPQPYRDLGNAIGIGEAEVMLRMRRMLDRGVVRRIAAVPNHYALGYRANGMSVWDVPDERADEMGRAVGALPFVTHCYRRPRYLPDWPYNLFAMVHGQTRAEVAEKVAAIEALIGPECRGHEVLYSTRILKKTGLRIAA
jgi:DNA-binding Lrp family transcriptional regulator